MPSAAPIANGWTGLLEHAVGEELDDDHAHRGVRPGPAERQQHAESGGRPGAEVGDVAADEGDRRDRADEGHAEDHAPIETTTALNPATIVTPRK